MKKEMHSKKFEIINFGKVLLKLIKQYIPKVEKNNAIRSFGKM